jgi:hypothetical protein
VYVEPSETTSSSQAETQAEHEAQGNPPTLGSENPFMNEVFNFDELQINSVTRTVERDLHLNSFNLQLKSEIGLYSNKIKEFIALCDANKQNKAFVKQNTKEFWLENRLAMPILFKTAMILLNISASSAFIERFLVFVG